jgi:hypothetical protein
MPEQVAALREPLFTAYKALARYQFERTREREMAMRQAIARATPMLRPFLGLLPPHKRRFVRALEKASQNNSVLNAPDLVLLFDQTIYELHIRLSPRESGEAAPSEPWSDALLALLDERREFTGPT